MGEAAKSYWLEEFISPSQSADADVEFFTAGPIGETEDDWKYGTD